MTLLSVLSHRVEHGASNRPLQETVLLVVQPFEQNCCQRSHIQLTQNTLELFNIRNSIPCMHTSAQCTPMAEGVVCLRRATTPFLQPVIVAAPSVPTPLIFAISSPTSSTYSVIRLVMRLNTAPTTSTVCFMYWLTQFQFLGSYWQLIQPSFDCEPIFSITEILTVTQPIVGLRRLTERVSKPTLFSKTRPAFIFIPKNDKQSRKGS